MAGSISTAWIPAARARLARGDTRGAFATFVRGVGGTPLVAGLPVWYLRLILTLVVRGEKWARIEPLLEACCAEHEEEATLDDGGVERYAVIGAPVLLLGGSRSPAPITTDLFSMLAQALPTSRSEIITGLDHFAPDEKAPDVVAKHLAAWFGT